MQRAEQEIGFLALWSLWAMTIAIPYNMNLVRDAAKRCWVNWLHERRTDEGSREIAALIVTLTK